MHDGAKTGVWTVRTPKALPTPDVVAPGSILSPFLFALVMDELMRHIQGKVP